ncbi:MAG: hypothetical protein HC872_06540, partial [Gammaproteobacteria bacterium]|nr:hypothetical protein [Gammaproteobacteria bacterium]
MAPALCLLAFVVAALTAWPVAAAQPLTIELAPANLDWMRRNQPIRLQLSRPLAVAEGRLAVLVGDMDVSDLLINHAEVIEYRPAPLPLRPGEYDVTVFLVTPQGQWQEAARLPIRVLTDRGLQRASFERRADMQGLQLLKEEVRPQTSTSSASPDAASLNLFVGGEAQRADWRWSGSMQVLGVSEQVNALQFAQRGAAAPRLDLSEYTLRLDRVDQPRGFLALGHLAYNQHRHLIPSFNSRGAMIGVPLGAAGSAVLTTMSGTRVVGWNNATGLSDADHRITATTIGFEVLPARPGALRIDADYLDGSVLPQIPFNRGNIADRQTSRAWGFRLATASASGRLRLEAGLARSAFDNPFDPTLAQGFPIVQVEREERGAQYAELQWTVLQGKLFGNQRVANLALLLNHERIDPQYATVATTLQADVLRNAVQFGGTVGPLQLQLGYTRLQDNLDKIASILTTHTRRSDAMLALPLTDLFQDGHPRVWLPIASWTYNSVQQAGEGVPPDSGFNASHVPDQASDRNAMALDWRGASWTFGLRHDRALQDNRQPGRERADFETRVHAIGTSFTPHPRLQLSLDWSRERNASIETGRITRTQSTGFGVRLAATDTLQLAATAGLARGADEPRTSSSRTSFLDASLTYQFEWQNATGYGIAGQAFLRYANRAQLATTRCLASTSTIAAARWSPASTSVCGEHHEHANPPDAAAVTAVLQLGSRHQPRPQRRERELTRPDVSVHHLRWAQQSGPGRSGLVRGVDSGNTRPRHALRSVHPLRSAAAAGRSVEPERECLRVHRHHVDPGLGRAARLASGGARREFRVLLCQALCFDDRWSGRVRVCNVPHGRRWRTRAARTPRCGIALRCRQSRNR